MAGRKGNRKGFTLMEVLVSIALIGILFTPMLAFFTHSAKMNTEVKNMQRANTVAQSVVEEFRSYATIQDLVETYWNDEGTSDKKFLTDGTYQKSTKPASIYTDGVFDKKGKYYFLEEGIVSDGKEYLAKITVEPDVYSSLNSKGLSVISSLGSEHTVVAKEEDETLEKIKEYRNLHLNKEGVDLDENYIAEKLKKTMKVVITDTDQSGNAYSDGMVHVHIYSEYSLTSPISGCENAQVGTSIYDGLMEESQLQGIYIFYNFDITNSNTIMQGLEVSVDYQQPHVGWKCNYTVYAVCQSIKYLDDTNPSMQGEDMDRYINMKHPEVNLSSTANINGTPYTDDASGMTAGIWTNFPSSNISYPEKKLEDIVGTEQIDRLSKLTVEVYDIEDTSRPAATIVSTRGE